MIPSPDDFEIIDAHAHPFLDKENGCGVPYGKPETMEEFDWEMKKVGIDRYAGSVFGPWKRSDKPVLTTKPGTYYSYLVSNPAPVIEPDGSIYMLFKTRKYIGRDLSPFYVGAARAKSPDDPFEVISPEPLFGAGAPNGEVEDPFVWIGKDGLYYMVAKDMRGEVGGSEADGVELVSKDGLEWKFKQVAYTRGGHSLRERPFILFDDKGDSLVLYTATADGFPYSDPTAQTWNAACRYELK